MNPPSNFDSTSPAPPTEHTPASLTQTHQSLTPPTVSSSKKLGDISALYINNPLLTLRGQAHSSTLSTANSHQEAADHHPTLGNFTKVFEMFMAEEPRENTAKNSSPPMGAMDAPATPPPRSPGLVKDAKSSDAKWIPPHKRARKSLEPDDIGFNDLKLFSGPESGISEHSDVLLSDTESEGTSSTGRSSYPSPDCSPSRPKAILLYQPYKNGPTKALWEDGRHRSELHSVSHGYGSCMMEQSTRIDSLIATTDPVVSHYGVNVFLDMSNIHINYLKTLKEKLGLPAAARFVKNPRMNLDNLTQILVRGRNVGGLMASCSIIPDRAEPAFIDKLRKLDYRVDVRKRQLVKQQERSTSDLSASTCSSSSANDSRYVEDLVDETLQTRIGEMFMKRGHKHSTLILVTGDAKPAPYSDGFYKTAKRALRQGWNVEVVCWSTSCSQMWRDLAESMDGDYRFRLIELDSYIGDLWSDDQ